LLVAACLLFISHAHAASNVLPDAPPEYNRWAWNDAVGWFDFQFLESQNVNVADAKLTGYASSSVGYVGLDCAATPNGNICSGGAGNWFVSNSIQTGFLAGWAWNDAVGWISFCGNASGGSTWNGSAWVCPASPTYQVKIVNVNGQGEFTGFAWNDAVGWISFNCSNDGDPSQGGVQGTCGTVSYRVKTSWVPIASLPLSTNLTSSVFDTCPTGVDCGGQVNSVMWRGIANAGVVSFQIASSNSSSGPWSFVGPPGTSASTDRYVTTGPGEAVWVSNALAHANQRYFRYRVFLECGVSDSLCEVGQGPQVDDIIVNWSP
jgi:hypothetical protein